MKVFVAGASGTIGLSFAKTSSARQVIDLSAPAGHKPRLVITLLPAPDVKHAEAIKP
jgi:hypothetical protein